MAQVPRISSLSLVYLNSNVSNEAGSITIDVCTHFRVTVFSTTPCPNKGVKPWLDTATHDCMQGLVWRFIATEEVQDVQLHGKG